MFEIADIAHANVPSQAGLTRVSPDRKHERAAGLRFVNEEMANGQDQWVSYVARVRDAQDQHAFAELFRHFAPRMRFGLHESMRSAEVQE